MLKNCSSSKWAGWATPLLDSKSELRSTMSHLNKMRRAVNPN